MRFVITQKTMAELDYSRDIYADIYDLFPRHYPATIKHAEYQNIGEARAENPGLGVMTFTAFVNFKAALDDTHKDVNLALKLRGKQKAIEASQKDEGAIKGLSFAKYKEKRALGKEIKRLKKVQKRETKAMGVFEKPWWKKVF